MIGVGHDANEFITACELALTLSDTDLADRAARMREIVARTSWVATADAMHELISARKAVAVKTVSAL
jgi:hypothetical protein